MKTEMENSKTIKQKPKSKRLSSLVWILVLWGIVYCISGSWKAFQNNALVLGLCPSSIFLLMSIFQREELYESVFRWSALASTFICFFVGVAIFGVGSGFGRAENFNYFSQILVTMFITSFVLFAKWTKGKKNG